MSPGLGDYRGAEARLSVATTKKRLFGAGREQLLTVGLVSWPNQLLMFNTHTFYKTLHGLQGIDYEDKKEVLKGGKGENCSCWLFTDF